MFVDGTKNSSVRRMELSFRNPGGHLGVQFEFHRRSVVSKIQKTMEFMLQLNSQTSHYSELIPFWKPPIFLPPFSWQYRKLAEEREKLEAENMSISWVHVLSVMPMIFFGIVVSCYIVIQPRGGLTYTDEEVDFTIQEIDSASRVNMVQPPQILSFKTAPISHLKPAASSASSDETNTAMEPSRREDAVPKTAIPLANDDIHTDPTALSEVKSTKTMRLPVKNTSEDGGNSAETLSLKTGRD
uniref:Transmembrane protein n=1 Tax=Caenorhabditis tropicalis TaxID=1561998 RepID=A0A1I7T595_9PELO